MLEGLGAKHHDPTPRRLEDLKLGNNKVNNVVWRQTSVHYLILILLNSGDFM
jgi:hypothetical protein